MILDTINILYLSHVLYSLFLDIMSTYQEKMENVCCSSGLPKGSSNYIEQGCIVKCLGLDLDVYKVRTCGK